MKILIADDALLSRRTIGKILTDNGISWEEAANGTEALERIEKSSPDLLILDLLMPDMDGFEVLEKLKEQGNTLPVIILSADIQHTSRERCLNLGAADFLNKPVTEAELLSIVRKNSS